MKGRPLVYLDTSDFIRFRSRLDDPSTRNVYERIISLRQSGQIYLGYLALNVWEFITNAPEDRFLSDRLERGRLMVELCGRNAFPYLNDLMDGAEYPNGGCWFPKSAKSQIKQTMGVVQKTFFEFLKGEGIVLNRKIRRAFQNPKLIANAIGTDVIEGYYGEFQRNADSGFETALFQRQFRALLLGEISEKQFHNRLISWMRDPAHFAEAWHQFGEDFDPIDRFVMQPFQQLEGLISDFIENIERYGDFSSSIRTQKRTINKLIHISDLGSLAFRELLDQLPAKIEEPNIEKIWPKGIGCWSSKLWRFDHIKHYVGKRAKKIGTFQNSDVADLMYLLYAYECTHFRCDRKMKNLFSDFEPFDGKLWTSLDDLVDCLEALN